MSTLSTVIVLGTVVGFQVGLQAMGLVLVYRANRFINFSQGQIGSLGAAALGALVLDAHVPYWLAVPLALGVGAATGWAVERLLGWRLFGGSRLALMIATIGVAQLILLLTIEPPLRIDPKKLAVVGYPEPFHFHLHLGRASLDASQVATLVLAPVTAAALFWFLGSTRLGVAIRGAASNPDAARLTGISVRRMSMIVWVIAALISSVAAILFAPSQPAAAFGDTGAGLLFESLAAALIAGMTDFRLALAAGLVVGLLDQGAVFYSDINGLPQLLVAGVLLAGLVLRARALAASTRSDDRLAAETSEKPVPGRIREMLAVRHAGRLGWMTLFGLLALLPALPGLRTQERAVFLLLMVSYALAGLGLTVLTGWAGQVSLGQFALLGVGAYTAAAADRHDLGLPAMLLLAGVVTAGVSVLVGLPAIRFRGLFLAAVTLAFAFVARDWLFRQSWVTGPSETIVSISRVRLFGLQLHTVRSLYLAGLAVLAAAVFGLSSLRRTNVGRALVGVRDNPDLASAQGLPPTAVKVTALALAGFVTGLGGAFWGMGEGTWSFTSFDPTMSFVLISCVIVGGIGTLPGPVLGVVAVFAWPYLVPNADTLAVRSFTSGAMLLAVLIFLPGGLASLLARARRGLFAWLDRSAPLVELRPRPGADPLEVTDVSLAFGGIQALAGASIHVRPGEIVGLIGGNGAGKSTLLACISGHLQPDAGRILVSGQDVVGLAPEYRPELGLRRTFQDARLFSGLTVTEALLLAIDAGNRSGAVGALASAPWVRSAERDKRDQVQTVLDSFGLAEHAHLLTSELSTGMRRICELAATVLARPALILLDEPTAGLAQREVEASIPLLRSLRDAHGAAVLIVEHDMNLMLSLCDRIYCLEAGRVIAEGPPGEMASDPRVIASYLGMDGVALQRTGGGAPAAGRRRSGTTGRTGKAAGAGRSAKEKPAAAGATTRASRAKGGVG